MRVVHFRKEAFTVYIGRPGIFGNPYSHLRTSMATTQVESREEAIRRFEIYARKNDTLLRHIELLPPDAILGCWCDPLPCHGAVIVQLWKELHDQV